jgi:hypothetical protein
MEIVYSIFIGMISSKIASKIDGIGLQCRRGNSFGKCKLPRWLWFNDSRCAQATIGRRVLSSDLSLPVQPHHRDHATKI